MSLIISPQDRNRSNSAFQFLQTNGFRRALLVDSQFWSTKFKLDILKKFQKTMLGERANEASRLLEEVGTQNQLMEQIRDAMKEKTEDRMSKEDHLERVGSVMSSELLDQLEKIEEEDGENDGSAFQRSKPKKSTIGNYFKYSTDFRSKHKSSTFAGSYSFMRNLHKQNSGATISRNNSKITEDIQISNEDNAKLQQYLKAKEKDLQSKEYRILKMQNKLIEIDKLKRDEQNKRIQQLNYQKKLMSDLLSNLVLSNVAVTDKQIELMQKMSDLSFQATKSVQQHFQ